MKEGIGMLEENQILEFQKQQMQVQIQNLEILVHKYHNVVQEASSFQTLAMAQILIPQIKTSLDSLQQLQCRCTSYAGMVQEKQK